MAENVILKTVELTKQFGGLKAVDGVSVHIERHKITGLIGSNGAGKTTLFNMISGAFKPTSGKVLYKGREIQTLPPHRICSLGVVRTHQIVKPFTTLSLLDNVVVGALKRYSSTERAREKAREVCETLQLTKRMDVIGAGLTLPELKRMELARALATEPEVLLLDEVMAGLNPTESMNMVGMIQSIADSGVTVVVIEHVMRAVMTLSDHIFVLDQGKLIAKGTPQQISESPQVIKSYLGEKHHA